MIPDSPFFKWVWMLKCFKSIELNALVLPLSVFEIVNVFIFFSSNVGILYKFSYRAALWGNPEDTCRIYECKQLSSDWTESGF